VACTAPDPTDYDGKGYVSACLPGATTGTSYRVDAEVYNSFAYVSQANFAASTSCAGTATQAAYASGPASYATGTTSLPTLAADGVTPVTGSGRTVTISITSQSGTFAASSTPLSTTGTYTLCKTSPSTTASTTVNAFSASNGYNPSFTPTLALSVSAAGTRTINTALRLNGNFFVD
jgi:hypothetical protein